MPDEKKPFHNPFAALAGLKSSLPERPAPAVTAVKKSAATPGPPGVKPVARAVVRMERSGRGGKDVTVVEHLDLSAVDRERWLKALKGALGCGGLIEDGAIVLQGDQRDRLPKLLVARGVRKVTVA